MNEAPKPDEPQRTIHEKIKSLRREGWTWVPTVGVWVARDGALVKVIFVDGQVAEGRIQPNERLKSVQ